MREGLQLKRLMPAGVRVLAVLLLVIGQAQAPARSQSLGSQALVRFRVRAITQAGVMLELPVGGNLRTGDKLWFEVETSVAMYLHLVQLFPDGSAALLYPQANKQVVSRPHQITRVPADSFEYFRLDEVTGREQITLIASVLPVGTVDSQLAKLIRRVQEQGRWPSALGAEAARTPKPTPALTQPEAARARATPAPTPSRPRAPSGYIEPSVKTRGLALQSDSPELRVVPDAQGVVVCSFEFNHLP